MAGQKYIKDAPTGVDPNLLVKVRYAPFVSTQMSPNEYRVLHRREQLFKRVFKVSKVF